MSIRLFIELIAFAGAYWYAPDTSFLIAAFYIYCFRLPRPKTWHEWHREQCQRREWKAFSATIKDERGNLCEWCGSTRRLCVHHKWYKKRRNLWDYPRSSLVVLCGHCHMIAHDRD